MVYEIIHRRKKPVLAYKEPLIQQNGLNKLSTIVSEVSFFVGNSVHTKLKHNIHISNFYNVIII